MEVGYITLIFTTTGNQDQAERFQQLVGECIEAGLLNPKNLFERKGCQSFFQVLKEGVENLAATITFDNLTTLNAVNDVLQIHCPVKVEIKALWNSFAVVSHSLAEKMHEFAENNASDRLEFRTSVQINDRGFFDIGKL